MGDALYALPAIRELHRRHGVQIDFFTSPYCAPLRRLFEAQSCIRRFIVRHDYVLQDFGCGCRPWRVPISEPYDLVHQMGFRDYPVEEIRDHIAVHAGLPRGLPILYEHALSPPPIREPYIVCAPRGASEFSDLFCGIAECSPLHVVEIGAAGDGTGSPRVLDKTGLDMIEVLPWLQHARGFVGLQSAMLVLANGYPIPKVAPQGPWDMRHVARSAHNHYPVDPTAAEALRLLGL